MARLVKWSCPFCQHDAMLDSEGDMVENVATLRHRSSTGSYILVTTYQVCPNPGCRRFTLQAQLFESRFDGIAGKFVPARTVPSRTWKLVPESGARPFPSYIPQPIIDDYREACSIAALSPKAAAALARKCLRGMIRDFWCIAKRRLRDEVDALQEHVSENAWAAIDGLRKVGNIGAHMETDVNTIVDVEPHEAELLLNLIELLITEWYVARHERNKRMGAIVEMATRKTATGPEQGTEDVPGTQPRPQPGR